MASENPSDRDLPTVLDAAQVARLLNLNLDYVRKLSREGVLPAHRLPGGRTFRYFKDEVLDWLRAQPVHDSDADEMGHRRAKDGGQR
jgi:excisionase family DNA binding protein